MSGFDASLEEIRSASVLLGDVGEGLRAELVSLTGEVDALAGSWRGAASSAFARGWSQWETGARDAIGALETMSGLLRAIGAAYAFGEDDSRGGVLASGQGVL